MTVLFVPDLEMNDRVAGPAANMPGFPFAETGPVFTCWNELRNSVSLSKDFTAVSQCST
jgi:hypothetical protein